MRGWLKKLLIACAVFALCWGGALWYWRSHNTMPGSADVVLYLILLPVVLLLVLWFAKKLVLLASAAALPASLPQAATAPDPVLPAAAPPLHMVAGALRLPHGQSPGELRDAIGANDARPALDPALLDDYGFPVMSARVDGLDTQATQEAMTAWLQTQALPDPAFSDEQWRALALGTEVAVELGQAATQHAHFYAAGDDSEPAAPRSQELPQLSLPQLSLVALLPAGWNPGQRRAAGLWLLQVLHEQGWPTARLVLSGASEPTPAEPLTVVAQLAQPGVAIVLACASHLGEATVDAWSQQGVLFSARNQRGQIPGEGAAGLLLADAAHAALFDSMLLPTLHTAVTGAHGASTDGPGQVDPALLARLGQDALRGAASVAADVTLVLGDADQRGSRTGELMAAALACAPQLDAATQVIGLSAVCGQTGSVATLAALVLARDDALEQASHVLYLGNQDAYQRSAAMVRPQPAQPAQLATSAAPTTAIAA